MQRLPRGVIDVTHAVPFPDTERKKSRRVRALPPVVAGKGREGGGGNSASRQRQTQVMSIGVRSI